MIHFSIFVSRFGITILANKSLNQFNKTISYIILTFIFTASYKNVSKKRKIIYKFSRKIESLIINKYRSEINHQ